MAGRRKMSLPYDQRISPLRMQQLKCSLIKWALDEATKREQEAQAKREAALAERVPAFPDLDSLDEEALKQLCRDLHGMCDKCDDNKYDLETKHEKQAREIIELQKRIQDIKAKFKKPALKRVKVTVAQMMKTLLGNKGKQVDMRSQLKKHVVINEGKED
ncbi:Oidioi.mRNA.OKI2018_I69.chr2.g5070.t1.cds [Oikopleura dioica]|uniref:Oidioi.mRNA.OKI2018_I69.chr2.g5070.t1.cds n=1 Tax=Oikopleura dioica TaxID=34765 RepID=A0ABN7T3M7_OIKDI|nr:Oidioi.mRNA.OKI2018_I69.chr2.g5070.t1.cds [Oikopleura dioica]